MLKNNMITLHYANSEEAVFEIEDLDCNLAIEIRADKGTGLTLIKINDKVLYAEGKENYDIEIGEDS